MSLEDLRQRMREHEHVTGQHKTAANAMQALQNHVQTITGIHSGIDQVMQQAKLLHDHLMTPPTIIRDPKTGRAVGVQKGERTYTVVRDANGKAVGLE